MQNSKAGRTIDCLILDVFSNTDLINQSTERPSWLFAIATLFRIIIFAWYSYSIVCEITKQIKIDDVQEKEHCPQFNVKKKETKNKAWYK